MNNNDGWWERFVIPAFWIGMGLGYIWIHVAHLAN